MDTIEAWSGSFGDDYLKRNRVDWRKRIPFWKLILDITGARSVLEFGCNVGWNLSAIKRTYPDVLLQGVEINDKARWEANKLGLDTYKYLFRNSVPREDLVDMRNGVDLGITFPRSSELVFTAGVLIHIPPETLKETMLGLVENSLHYVLAVEYEAEKETEIEYRGQMGLLWKRPYGKLYEEMGLTLIETGMVKKDEGFDDCRYWLMRK